MAPPQHEIWGLFSVAVAREKGVKAHPDAKCNACGEVVENAQPSRNLLRHVINKCDKLDPDAKARWLRYDSDRRHRKAEKLVTPAKSARTTAPSPGTTTKRLFSTPRSPSPSTGSRKKQRRSSLKSGRQKEEDSFLRVAMGFIATGIPFRVIDDPHFRVMFDYKLPSRHQLSGRLLDLIFAREMEKIIALMSGVSEWALVTDGWSNVNGDSFINFVFVNPKMPPVFWKSINTRAEIHSGRYIADSILATIQELENAIGPGVVTAVVTYNASNMKRAWKLVRMERRGIVCTGCIAHGMNLLMKDIFKLAFFKDVLEKSQKLARFIKARRGLWSRFRDTQKQLRKQGEKRRRLSLTVATRWYTHEKCISNVVQNRDVIATLFSDTDFLKSYKGSDLDEATVIFKNGDFWLHATLAVRLIHPINASLAAFESDNCSISLVYHQFQWLKIHEDYTMNLEGCSRSLQLDVLRIIEDRQKKICWKPLGIAHMLDQTKSVDGYDAKEMIDEATQLATKLGVVAGGEDADLFHQQLQEFVLDKCKWNREQQASNARYSPLNWWSLPTSRYKQVQQFAKVLLSIPTSSASSERSWSIHAFIHTKLRNRLTPERVNKLFFVYTNIARKASVNHIMYELFPDACVDSDFSDDSESERETDANVVRIDRLQPPEMVEADGFATPLFQRPPRHFSQTQ